VAEIGPSLKHDVVGGQETRDRITLDLPIRSAFAVSFDEVRQIGWVSNPQASWVRRLGFAPGSLRFTAATGPVFGDGRYHNYFYQVPARDARPERPRYEADAGYGGWKSSLGLSWRVDDVWFGAFVRYIDTEGATFEDSPLVRTRHYLMGGIAAAWIFAGSDRSADD
jgi:outer membrane scaffolding protein for murein synthesis (MipA/OmpV family)